LKLAGFCFFAKVERKQQMGVLGPSPLPSMSGGVIVAAAPKTAGLSTETGIYFESLGLFFFYSGVPVCPMLGVGVGEEKGWYWRVPDMGIKVLSGHGFL
jgi:hypothetical protein